MYKPEEKNIYYAKKEKQIMLEFTQTKKLTILKGAWYLKS